MSETKPDNVQRLVECLAEIPEAGSPLTKRKTVALLAGAIQRARDEGHTLKQIARQLQNNGFDIGYAALRNELPRQKKARSGPKKPRAVAADRSRTRVVAPPSRAAPREREQSPRADVRAIPPTKAPERAPAGAVPPVAFPPGAACVFTGDGCFIPAPDSDDL